MDTYTRFDLDFPTHTHPAQGIIPFSVVQSLRLYIPFKCHLVCPVRNNQPSRSISEVPHALDLSGKLPLPLLTDSDQIKEHNNSNQGKSAHTAKYQLPVLGKTLGNPKTDLQMEKTRGREIQFQQSFNDYLGPKLTYAKTQIVFFIF